MTSRTFLTASLATLLLLGCSQAPGDGDGRSLSTVEAVAPGEHCPAGGQMILTGVDANGDGVLQASEVAQVAYVCNGQSAATCTTLEGSITVRNSFDWANLVQAGCTRITGTLEITAQGARSLGDPSPLVEVGSLQVHGNDALTALDFPALTTVNGDLAVSGNAALTSLRHAFPALATVHGAVTADDDAALLDADLPALAAVGGGIWYHLLLLPGDLAFPALASVQNGITLDTVYVPGTLSLPQVTDLSTLAGELHLYGGGIAHVELPRLVVGDLRLMDFDTLQELVLPALTGPSTFMFDGVSIPRLSAPGLSSGGVFIRGGIYGSIDLPAFASGYVDVESLAGLTDLALPSFRTGPLTLAGMYELERFSAPGLVRSRIDVHANLKLTSLDLPALVGTLLTSDVEGPPPSRLFLVQDNPVLPQCQVDALLARIVDPPAERILMSGNDTTATCP